MIKSGNSYEPYEKHTVLISTYTPLLFYSLYLYNNFFIIIKNVLRQGATVSTK